MRERRFGPSTSTEPRVLLAILFLLVNLFRIQLLLLLSLFYNARPGSQKIRAHPARNPA